MNSPDEVESLFRVDLPARPYPGLRPFEKHEWPIFFGRERMTDAIVAQLIRQRLIVVHGDSGCGKSSLILAGVLPRLEQDNARGGCCWRTCTLTPGEAPLWNLARALAELDGSPAGEERVIEIRRLLNAGRHAPEALAERLCHAPDTHVCLLIDQFEELFDHARRHEPDEARLLTDILVGLFTAPPEGLYAVLTMRSEFLGACARFQGFAETVNATQYLLPRMGHADLLRAIREPALLYDGTVSRELAERLIADSGGGQDQLPLIQHGLMLLHRQQSTTPAWRLGLEHYPRGLGLAGLLSEHADAVMHEVQQAHRQVGDSPRLVEDLFRALTDINAEGQAIRRPQTLARLVAVTGAREAALRAIIDAFRADGVSFLRPYGNEPIAAQERIDVSHEALIRCWRKIAEPEDGWLIREFRNGLVWRALLVQADSFERDPTNVLAPTTTDERELWLRRRNPAWAERYGGGWERVQRLLAASAAERDRKRAEQAAAKRRETRLRTAIVGLVFTIVLSSISGYLGIYAWQQSDIAKAELEEARIQFANATAARARSEELREEAQQTVDALRKVVAELERVIAEADLNPMLELTLHGATGDLSAQVYNLAAVARQPAELSEEPPPPPATPAIAPRVYVHIADEDQREPARAFQRQLAMTSLDGVTVIVPGIELVKAAPRRSELRCFRAAECRDDGEQLLELVNGLLIAPQLVLQDLSARYGASTSIRDRLYEIWFAPGEEIRLGSD
ncbi:hypothetical protein [Halomonas sp. BM-2019]|uniref:nSTAND1 domain-containing NTPase n=1 Tax=Halomonas sp. BM-2019 TaxID=2811227 RepID=UPI001B3C25D3|nr:MAG: ATP-binding protein [Halomonas sp. BM-2019]